MRVLFEIKKFNLDLYVPFAILCQFLDAEVVESAHDAGASQLESLHLLLAKPRQQRYQWQCLHQDQVKDKKIAIEIHFIIR